MTQKEKTIKTSIFYLLSLNGRFNSKKSTPVQDSQSPVLHGGWETQRVDGFITESELEEFGGLPWEARHDPVSNEPVLELRCYNLPVLHSVKISVECNTTLIDPLSKIKSIADINLHLIHDNNDYGWQPDKTFSTPQALLAALKSDPQPFLSAESTFTDMLLNTFRVVVDKINTGLERDQIVESVEQGIDILDRVLSPFSRIVDSIEWRHLDVKGHPYDNGNYRWVSKHPMRYELSRLVFLIAQNILFGHHPVHGSGLQLLKSPLAKKIDLSFIKERRAPVVGKPDGAKAKKTNKRDPGSPSRGISYWEELSSFAIKKDHAFWVDNQGDDLCRSTLILMDYAERLGNSDLAPWCIESFTQFMTDAKYRESCMKPIAVEYFNQDSSLDIASNYWIVIGKKETEKDLTAWLKKGVRMMRLFDQYKCAIDAGLSTEEVSIYSLTDLSKVQRRLSTMENNKAFDYSTKWRAHLDHAEERGHLRYMAPLLSDWSPKSLIDRFPNFKEVCLSVERQLRLCKMQKVPVVRMHPILIVGDPGIGKTRFASALAESLNIEFHEIPMSSMSTGWILSGLDLSWGNGRPGRISDILINGLSANPLVILDELDKTTGKNDDPFGSLYQLLEQHTAKKFMDEALRLNFNTQHMIWFATANDLSKIPDPILDRFEIIEIPDLTPKETHVVARSIYRDLRESHPWGYAFSDELPDEVVDKMHGLNARTMFRMLRTACSIAAERGERPVVLQASDLERKKEKSGGMGFLSMD